MTYGINGDDAILTVVTIVTVAIIKWKWQQCSIMKRM